MTPSHSPHEFELPDQHDEFEPPSEHVSNPGELIAAVPALLGFCPVDSVLAVALKGTETKTLGPVMRHDYFPCDGGTPARPVILALEQFAAVCAVEEATGVILIVVGAYPFGESLTIASAFADLLAPMSIDLVDALSVPSIETDCVWTSVVQSDRHGIVPDPSSSSVAAAQVWGGRIIRGSRDELVNAVRGRSRDHRVIAELIDLIRASAAGDSDDDEFGGVRSRVSTVLRQVERVGNAGVRLSAEEYARLAVALTDVRVRDVLMGLAITRSSGAAEMLWTALTHELPDPERAWPATLLGYSAYVRGDGPLAGIAFAQALESDPDHSLAWLLDISLQSGVRPDGIRDLAAVGLSIGQGFDITELPPQTNCEGIPGDYGRRAE
ncbi:hypothetical protein ABH922_001703 [Rhodococcus sp. 27YEA15]|uniref:DUF4192 domain-containing protein n=1 Tax=Rhodococcus sp. 27YEA15 TaxID=3156259 RepID=UPI003C7B3728